MRGVTLRFLREIEECSRSSEINNRVDYRVDYRVDARTRSKQVDAAFKL